jgi:hypothetical protein
MIHRARCPRRLSAFVATAVLAAAPSPAGAQQPATRDSAAGAVVTTADAYRAGIAAVRARVRARADLAAERVAVRPQGPAGPALAGIPFDVLEGRLAETRVLLAAALDEPELAGMRAFADAALPTVAADAPVVGVWRGRRCTTPQYAEGVMANVTALLDRLEDVGDDVLVDLELRSDPPGASIVLQASGGPPNAGTTNGPLRLYRGLYSYAVSRPGFADGSGEHLDLVTQPGTVLRCTMQPARPAHPADSTRPAARSTCALTTRP